MKLLLVRHGETDAHLKRLLLGQKIDAGLNKNGIKQSEKLALRLKNVKIDAIFSSDLKRAKETAQIINKYHNTKIKFSKNLRERNFGIFQGKPKESLLKAASRSGVDFHNYTPKNGESCLEVQKRAISFLNKVIKKYPKCTVLFSAHGAVIMELLFYFTKLHRSRFKELWQDIAALNVIEISPKGKHKIKIINSVSHLE